MRATNLAPTAILSHATMTQLLTEDQLATALSSLPKWQREGAEITRTYAFSSYLAGINFVSQVAVHAETMNHHPDIFIGWRKVTLRLSTHSRGGLTELDMAMARQCDETAKSTNGIIAQS